MFKIGDKVYIKSVSLESMYRYAIHNRVYDCPCRWKNKIGMIIKLDKNYAFIEDYEGNYSVFHIKDLKIFDRNVEEI